MRRDLLHTGLVLAGLALGAIAALDWLGYSLFVFQAHL